MAAGPGSARIFIDPEGVIRGIIRGERVWDAHAMKKKIGKR